MLHDAGSGLGGIRMIPPKHREDITYYQRKDDRGRGKGEKGEGKLTIYPKDLAFAAMLQSATTRQYAASNCSMTLRLPHALCQSASEYMFA